MPMLGNPNGVSMVDIVSRLKAQGLLVKLLTNGISSYALEDLWPRSKDRVIAALFDAIDAYYDDYPETTLSAESFPDDVVVIIRRAVTFLGSGLEYEWPPFRFTRYGIPVIRRLLRIDKKYEEDFEEFKKCGDFCVWPFFRESDARSIGVMVQVVGVQGHSASEKSREDEAESGTDVGSER